ncbi:hypothetical protein NQD34_000226 [Periophthalmus magnuspinnatus]|nr:hypothetical protein NQD34_000226 [Periophthalmus magnuspinnatus]
MDRTGVPQTLLLIPRTLFLQLLCFSASLSLYTRAPPAPSQVPPPSGPVSELQHSPPSSQCSLRVEPPELVVRFGDPVSVNCSTSQFTLLGWVDVPTVTTEVQHASLLWTEESLGTWSVEPVCYAITEVGQCQMKVPVTVYQPPNSVSVSFRNHSGPLLENSWPLVEDSSWPLVEDSSGPLLEPLEEGLLYCLQCEVEAVAPAQNMTVAFYRGLTELSVMRINTTHKSPVNVSFCLDYRANRQDHGAGFWCEARLELGPEGPQPPPVVKSHTIMAMVHFTEEQVEAPPTRSSTEQAGRDTVSAQSQQRQHSGAQDPRGAGHTPGSSAVVLLALLMLHI